MVFTNLCVLVLWIKIALALEGLRGFVPDVVDMSFLLRWGYI